MTSKNNEKRSREFVIGLPTIFFCSIPPEILDSMLGRFLMIG